VKGDRPPPDTAIVSVLLRKAAAVAPQVDKAAAEFASRNRVARALATLRAAVAERGLDSTVVDEVAPALTEVRDAVEVAAPGTTAINVHPALGFLLEPGRWRLAGS
jgi:hypothetical protein